MRLPAHESHVETHKTFDNFSIFPKYTYTSIFDYAHTNLMSIQIIQNGVFRESQMWW